MKKRMQNCIKVNVFFIIILVLISLIVPVNAEALNNNPMLENILINGSEIEPAFDMFTTEYVITVSEETTSIQIEAIPDDENATVEIIGDIDNLSIGRNEIEILVIAENGTNSQSYYIYVTRGNEDETNANLSSLTIENATLAPSFDTNTINYAIEYPQELEQLEIEAIPEDDNATVTIIGNENLTEVTQTIEIQVTAPDGQTTKTYYVIAKKEGMEVESSEGEEPTQTVENEEEISENIPLQVFVIIIIIVIAIIIFVVIFKIKKNKDNNKVE